jgi:hypothetical protein
MRSHRTIALISALLAALSAAAPASAPASSLLSGYGGPGSGSQAILGATLLNRSRGGGGSGPGPGSSTGSSRYSEQSFDVESSSTGAVNGKAKTGSGSTAPDRAKARGDGGRAERGAGASGKAEKASAGTAQTYPASSAGAGSEALGLSGTDFLYVLLVLAGLAATGVLTRWLVRATTSGGYPTLKKKHAGPE